MLGYSEYSLYLCSGNIPMSYFLVQNSKFKDNESNRSDGRLETSFPK